MAKFADLTATQKRAALRAGNSIPAVGAFSAAAGNVVEQAIVEISEDIEGIAAAPADNVAAPAAYAAVVNMTNPVTKAEGEAVSAALAALRLTVANLMLKMKASGLMVAD